MALATSAMEVNRAQSATIVVDLEDFLELGFIGSLYLSGCLFVRFLSPHPHREAKAGESDGEQNNKPS